MAFKASDSTIGYGGLNVIDTVQVVPLGSRIKGTDSTYGEGEFIYLKGVASLVAGNAVVYDEAYVTTRTVAASRGPVAVALAAVVAAQFGWFQIQGMAVVTAGTVAADTKAQTSATAGSLDDTATAAQDIASARFMTADGTPVAGQAIIALAYPFANGTMI
jgi:hypothetical protein